MMKKEVHEMIFGARPNLRAFIFLEMRKEDIYM